MRRWWIRCICRVIELRRRESRKGHGDFLFSIKNKKLVRTSEVGKKSNDFHIQIHIIFRVSNDKYTYGD